MGESFGYLIFQYIFSTLLMGSILRKDNKKEKLKRYNMATVYILILYCISNFFTLHYCIVIAQIAYILLFPINLKIYKRSCREVAFVYYSSMLSTLPIITVCVLIRNFAISNKLDIKYIYLYYIIFIVIGALAFIFNLLYVAKIYRPNIEVLKTKIGYLISGFSFSYVILLTLLFMFIVENNSIYGLVIYVLFCSMTLIFYPIVYHTIKNIKSLEKAKSIIDLDVVTEAYSRIKFDEDILNLISSKKEFTLFYIDVNDFKLINDNNGHIFGDYCLKYLTTNLKSNIGKYGNIYRVGGDEFSIITTECEKICDRINNVYSTNLYLKNDKNENVNISFSVGQAMYPINGKDVNEILSYADKEMYRNKCIKKLV